MPAQQVRNEGVSIRPFTGSQNLENTLHSSLKLEVSTAQTRFDLSPSDKLTIPPSELKVAGIELVIQDLAALFLAVDPMVMSRGDVDLLVVAVDGPASPIRTSEVLYKSTLAALGQKISINAKGSTSDSIVLSNSHGRYSLEVALVHNKEIASVSATRPRKKGALLAKAEFTLKPTGVNDQPKPIPMDKTQKQEFGLGASAWFYLKPTSSLLDASSFEEAFDFYVDKELLEMLKVAKPSAQPPIEGLLMALLVQGLCYEVASRADELSDMDPEEIEDGAVARLLKQSMKVKTFARVMESLSESPSKASTKILGVSTLLNGLHSSLEEATDD